MCYEEHAEIVRRIFDMYVNEGMGSHSIAVRLTDEGVSTPDRQAVVVSVRRAPHTGKRHLQGHLVLRQVPPRRDRGWCEGPRTAAGQPGSRFRSLR